MKIFQSIVKAKKRLDDAESKIKELTEVTSIDFSYMGSKTASRSGRTENMVMQKLKLEGIYIDRLCDYIPLLKEFEDTITELSSDERYFLRLRYLDLLEWGEIEKRIQLSHSQVFRIHRRILSKLKGRGNEKNGNAS